MEKFKWLLLTSEKYFPAAEVFIFRVTRVFRDIFVRLWHQLTLAVEELSTAACFSVVGNRELLDLYKAFVADQPQNSAWTGFASRMNPLKHASLAIVVSKQYGGRSCLLSIRLCHFE